MPEVSNKFEEKKIAARINCYNGVLIINSKMYQQQLFV